MHPPVTAPGAAALVMPANCPLFCLLLQAATMATLSMKPGQRFTLPDWQTSYDLLSSNAERQRLASHQVRQEARILRNETNNQVRRVRCAVCFVGSLKKERLSRAETVPWGLWGERSGAEEVVQRTGACQNSRGPQFGDPYVRESERLLFSTALPFFEPRGQERYSRQAEVGAHTSEREPEPKKKAPEGGHDRAT